MIIYRGTLIGTPNALYRITLFAVTLSDDKPLLEGAWSGHVNHLNFVGTNHISETVSF